MSKLSFSEFKRQYLSPIFTCTHENEPDTYFYVFKRKRSDHHQSFKATVLEYEEHERELLKEFKQIKYNQRIS